MKTLPTCVVASLLVAAAGAPAPADAAKPEAAAKPEDAARVLILGKDDKTPTDFIARQGPRGIIQSIARFREALPEGFKAKIVIGKFFNPNWGKFDDTIRVMTPLDPNGDPHGVELHFRPKRRGCVRQVTYRHGVQHGEERKYGVHGQRSRRYLRSISPWKNGELHGVVKILNPDGNVVGETPYVHGKQHGISKSYDSDGELIRTVHYKDGLRHGVALTRWPTTKNKKSEIPYRNGKVHGVVRLYYDSGKLHREVRLWQGKYHGTEKLWDEEGKLRKTQYWLNDEKVDKVRFERDYAVPPKGAATRPAKAKGGTSS
jgi:antitoxin component YwqK of YwqJK toxin-antitoxin module